MRGVRWVLALVLVSAFSFQLSALSDDWAAWRGPNQDGSVAAPGYFPAAPFGLEVVWSRDIGSGYSGISVAGGRVLTMFADGTDDLLGAFDGATGAGVWRVRLGPMYEGHDGGHDGPVSTPVSDGANVYALGADGRLVAVSLEEGRERWSLSLPRLVGARAPFWGFCTTPLVAGDVLVVQAGGSRGRAVCGLDRERGAIRWTSDAGGSRVDYRSPVLAELNGRRQVLVCGHGLTAGVDPATGETLWSHPVESSSSTTPLFVAPDCVLVRGGGGASLIQVPKTGRPRTLWRTNELGGNYDAPVRHGNAVYGFSGAYLTCVDLHTGDARWCSRPPGGKGLIAVDGHLVTLGYKGDLVVVEASPQAYREAARLNVSDGFAYSWPSFADGTIYVRNLRHLVAVRPGPAPSVVAADPARGSRFAAFLRELEASSDPGPALDEFMARQDSFPIVEDDRLVHFVYRGHASDVAILGNMIAQQEAEAMHRVAGTDFFHRSYAIEPGARWEYQLDVDLGRVVADPLNPRRVEGVRRDGQPVSEVRTSGYADVDLGPAPPEGARGRLESFRAAGRDLEVYLPHGAERPGPRPLVVVSDGRDWLRSGRLPAALDALCRDRIDPPVVAFVDAGRSSSHRDLGGAGTRDYVRLLAEEIVPALERRYDTRRDPAGRIVFGHRAAAVAAVCAALEHPEVFGRCVAISYGRADTPRARWVAERIAEAKGASGGQGFHVTWNRYEIWRPQSFDCREQSRALVDDLSRHGYAVEGVERLDGAGWGAWRNQAAEALIAVLGKKPKAAR